MLDLARDYSRFVIMFFDLITASAPHIYITALPLSPRTSLVREVYERHQRPLVRVVRGLFTSWEVVVTSIYHRELRGTPAWSPCNRFIAVARGGTVEIRDAVTLSLLNTFKSPPEQHLSQAQVRFSPDSRFITSFNRADLITWDLQTGGPVGVCAILPGGLHTDNSNPSSTYSTDGKMVAAVYLEYTDEDPMNPNTFIATHDYSTTHAHLYRVPEKHLISPIWAHGEFLRFATLEPGYITIREVEFTSTQTPEVVESLPTPDKIADAGELKKSLFLPTLSRLAIASEFTLLIWDARDSKLLLGTPALYPEGMSFSSDGRFFAHGDHDGVRVWKESTTGYVLHQKLAFSPSTGPLLSPNGESIIASPESTIHLWHTKNPILSDDQIPASDEDNFCLEFSPCQAYAAFARLQETRVTILDLQSGDPQLEIEVAERVSCLGITESSIVVVSDPSVFTWDLTTRTTTAVTQDRARILQLDPSPSGPYRSLSFISVSPDLSRVATTRRNRESRIVSLEIYDTVTGRCLASAALGRGVLKLL